MSIFGDTDYMKVKKKAKVRNRYNQVPDLSWDTIWESEKIQGSITHTRAKSPFPACDQKAAKNRQDSLIKTNKKHK